MYQCHTFAVPCPSHCAAPELSDQLQPMFFLLKKDQLVTHSAQRVPRKVRNCLLLSDASLEQTQEAGEVNQNTDRIICYRFGTTPVRII